MRLLLVFIAIPLTELWLLFQVADVVGGFETVLLVIMTAFIGVMLLRSQGVATLNRANEKWQMGGLPAQEMVEGLMLACSGALLLTPGFITDALGFLILLPPVRRYMAAKLAAKGVDSLLNGFSGGQTVRFGFGSGFRGASPGASRRAAGRFGGGRTFEGTVTESTYAANDGDKRTPEAGEPGEGQGGGVIDSETVFVTSTEAGERTNVVVMTERVSQSTGERDAVSDRYQAEDEQVIDVDAAEGVQDNDQAPRTTEKAAEKATEDARPSSGTHQTSEDSTPQGPKHS